MRTITHKNLSSLICSCRVRLYVLKDFGVNPSLTRSCDPKVEVPGIVLFFLLRRRPRICETLCSSKGSTFVFELISACSWVAVVDFELIHISLSCPYHQL